MTESGTFFTLSLGKLHDYLWPVHHFFTPYNDGSVFKRSPFVSFLFQASGTFKFPDLFPKDTPKDDQTDQKPTEPTPEDTPHLRWF